MIGTLRYMSPEQAKGAKLPISVPTSFRSVLVLYEMVTGVPAFQKNTPAETAAAILRDEPERTASRMLQAPAPFVWIVERCLDKDPAQRYASTRDLARDLAAVHDRLADAPARRSEPRPSNHTFRYRAPLTMDASRRRPRTANLCTGRMCVLLHSRVLAASARRDWLCRWRAKSGSDFQVEAVSFVSLSVVREPGLVASAIAQTVGVRETGGKSAQESMKDYLGGLDQPMLLLLDNFEHLVSAAPDISDLLSAGPKLKIVVTSQSPLHVYGEHEFPVPPLLLPDSKSLPPLDALSRLPSVALFVERARAVKHDFALSNENAPAVAAVCARLDGLPLAIELAAARIKMLSPSAMLVRLESCLNLLTGGARDLPTRQQTLRGTVDWSYGLLNPAEQTLFRRISVFLGGCTLEAVEAVCDTAGELGLDVLDGMASMVDKSLAQQVGDAAGETRFLMLSTIREYALERLAASDDVAATRRSHAAYYLVLAEEGALEAALHPEWLDRFEVEHDNFRAALEYLTKAGDADWGLRLGTALFHFWETREYLTEGRSRIARLLALEGAASRPKLRSRLLFSAAVLAGEQGDYTSAHQLFEESLETCVELNDNRGVAVALNALAVNARDRGEFSTASLLLERCVAIWRDEGDPADVARALSNLANVAKLQGEATLASSLYDECLAIFRKVGDVAGIAWTLNYQGDVARESNDLTAARSYYEQSLAAFSLSRDGWGIASALSDLAGLSWDQGDNGEARRLYGESIQMFQSLGHKRGIARVLECLAANAAAQSNGAQALRFAGAAAALRERLGAPLTPAEQHKLEKVLQFARRTLGNAAGLTAWMEGWALPVEQAIDDALSAGPESTLRTGSDG